MRIVVPLALVIVCACSGATESTPAPSTHDATVDARLDPIDGSAPPLDTSLPAPDTSVIDTSSPETSSVFDAKDAPALDSEVGIAELCFGKITKTSGSKGPVYDKFKPIVGSHCFGTNHQDIKGVEQVVFLGDSVTVGTPNTKHPVSSDNGHFYRNKLAEHLATTFSVDKGSAFDWGLWKTYDYINGVGGKLQSGNFKNCAKWGARTDDFIGGGAQLAKCFPTGGSDKKTLFVFTMGGNDISAITKAGADASAAEVDAGYPTVWATAKKVIKDLDDAVAWMTDPVRFPKGSYVVMGNPFEFTDATGDVSSCPAAGLAGYKDWKKPEVQVEIVVQLLENYMDVAVKRKVDLLWMLEHFCGHGYVATKASTAPPGACFLGPGTPLWFDETCIHPNDPGHDAIYSMFKAIITE